MPKDHKVNKRLKEYTATAINQSCEAYRKVIASENNSDIEKGAIEHTINGWYEFLDYYRQHDVLEQNGNHKLMSLNFFSGIIKAYREETLEEYTKKYIAMMIRRNIAKGEQLDTVWGTKWNCEHATRYYFNNNNCFVMESTNDKKFDILKNGFTSDKWKIDNKVIKDSPLFIEEAGLINIKGVRFKNNTILKTRKSIVIKTNDDNKNTHLYSLHFFIRSRKTGNNKECIIITFTNKTGEIAFKKTYTSDFNNIWLNKSEYIRLEDGEYNIELKGANNCDLDLDFMCLFPAVNYPSISVLVGSRGQKNNQALFFAPGRADKIKDENGQIIFTKDIKEGTHKNYKFWFPFSDDTTEEAKKGMKEHNIVFNDPRWGYWTQDGYFISLTYFTELLDVLIPVGVSVFDIISTKIM